MSKILIHTTSLTEAQPIVDFFNLEKLTNPNENTIYSNDDLILIVSGVSKEKILDSLNYIFKNFQISKAFDFCYIFLCRYIYALYSHRLQQKYLKRKFSLVFCFKRLIWLIKKLHLV